VLRWDLPVLVKRLKHATDEAALIREFDLLAALRAPCLPALLELGFEGGAYLVRDLVEGVTIARTHSASERILDWIRKLARTLTLVHASGMAHGDIKPAHILVNASGPWLIDFGLGVLPTDEGRGLSGTAAYMAPELWQQRCDEPRSADVYALAATLFELLAGRPAFQGDSLDALHRAHLGELPALPSLDTHPELIRQAQPALQRLLNECFAKDPRERPSMRQFANELACFLEIEEQDPPRWGHPPLLGRELLLAESFDLCIRSTKPSEREGLPMGCVIAAPGSGKSRLLESLKWSLQRARVRVLCMPPPSPRDPWRQLRNLLELCQFAIAGHENRSQPSFAQRLCRGERATALLAEAFGRLGACCLLWDDVELSSPETLRSFELLAEQAEDLRLSLFFTCSQRGWWSERAERFELQALDFATFEPWLQEQVRCNELSRSELERARNVITASGALPAPIARFLLHGAEPSHSDAFAARDRILGHLPPALLVVLTLLKVDREMVALQVLADALDHSPERLAAMLAEDALLLAGQQVLLKHTLDVFRDGERPDAAPSQELVNRLGTRSDLDTLLQRLDHALELGGEAYAALRLELALQTGEARADRLAALWPAAERSLRLQYAYGRAYMLLLETFERIRGPRQAGEALCTPSPSASTSAEDEALLDALVEHAIAAGRALELLRAFHVTHPSGLLRSESSPPGYDFLSIGRLACSHTLLRRWEEQGSTEEPPVCSGFVSPLAIAYARLAAATGDSKPLLRILQASDFGCSPSQALALHRLAAEDGLRSGRLLDVRRHAELGLALCAADSPQGLSLTVLDAAARAFAAERGGLEALEGCAAALLRGETQGSALARYYSYLGIAYGRSGRLDEAARAYRRGLEEVEKHHLDEDLPTYFLNLGTANHRLGRLGIAREYYGRGSRACTPNTRLATRIRLACNRAGIDLRLGRVDEAQLLLRRARRLWEQSEAPASLGLLLDLLDSDVLVQQGQEALGHTHYLEIASRYAELGDNRRRAEVLLKAAMCSLRAGEWTRARIELDASRRLIEMGDFRDLDAEQALCRAQLMLLLGGVDAVEGIERYREALHAAFEGHDYALLLERLEVFLRHATSEGLEDFVVDGQQLGQRSASAVAMGLDASLRRTLLEGYGLSSWLQTRRSPGGAEQEPTQATAGSDSHGEQVQSPDLVSKYRRLLAFNHEVLHADTLMGVLSRALDVALELSRAERAFVLLRRGASNKRGLRVAMSRDLDGHSVQRPLHKLSATIAQKVIQTRQPLVTAHARSDERFDSALSIQEMELSSVLCVPICVADEVKGALYLDHRFWRAAFDEQLVALMTSFADQLALALLGAERSEQLEQLLQEQSQLRERLASMNEENLLLRAQLDARHQELRAELDARLPVQPGGGLWKRELIASSLPMRRVLERIERVLSNTIPVVILGESGTGKELVARAIHFNGPRASQPFIAVNCGALSEGLLESELFGAKKGAYTGGVADRDGLFVAADKGTLFLDELGEMPLSMQVKLLRALQDGRVRPVGSTRDVDVDVRIIAATNRDLDAMVREGSFREDLYYRVNGISITVPALRERREDIPLLVRHFLQRLSGETGIDYSISAEATVFLSAAPWPGNVRQLDNVVRTAAALCLGHRLELVDVAALLDADSSERGVGRPRRIDAAAVSEALAQHGGARAAAAAQLGISERSLYRYLKRFGLN
jgi:transcriptional regulator with GAF, ATPase, and Fis domain